MDDMPLNYVRVSGILPWRAWYFYVDAMPRLADRIFRRHELKVHFKDHLTAPDRDCRIVSAWVRRRDAAEFELCMEELYRSSLVHGRKGYEDSCEWLMRVLDDMEDS